jgi:hypothetical protein
MSLRHSPRRCGSANVDSLDVAERMQCGAKRVVVRRAVCLPTLTSLQLLLRAAVADEAEPTRFPISGVGATGT